MDGSGQPGRSRGSSDDHDGPHAARRAFGRARHAGFHRLSLGDGDGLIRRFGQHRPAVDGLGVAPPPQSFTAAAAGAWTCGLPFWAVSTTDDVAACVGPMATLLGA